MSDRIPVGATVRVRDVPNTRDRVASDGTDLVGRTGTLTQDDHTSAPYAVQFPGEQYETWFQKDDLEMLSPSGDGSREAVRKLIEETYAPDDGGMKRWDAGWNAALALGRVAEIMKFQIVPPSARVSVVDAR